jgi:hypothetical protein
VVQLHEVESGKVRHTLRDGKHRLTSLAFSGDGKRLAAGAVEVQSMRGLSGMTAGARIRLWDVASGDEQTLTEQGQKVAFLPGGKAIVSTGWYIEMTPAKGGGFSVGGGSRGGVWSLARNRRLHTFEQPGRALALSHDGRYLATGVGSYRHSGGLIINSKGDPSGIGLHETATGKTVWTRSVKPADAAILTLTPDGRTLIAGGMDGGLNYHDLAPEDWSAPTGWKAADYQRAWQTLAGEDAVRGYAAVWDLSSLRDESVAFLGKQMKATEPAGPAVRRLIADLDSNDFSTRQAAQKELAKFGGAVEAELREASRKASSKEVKLALAKLLADLERGGPGGEQVRQGRALTVLERIGTPAAVGVLKRLAAGAPGASLTEEARRALARLTHRQPLKPLAAPVPRPEAPRADR